MRRTPPKKTPATHLDGDCGFPGVETQMPLMLTEVSEGALLDYVYVRWSAANPAKIWGIYPKKGVIARAPTPTSPSSTCGAAWTLDDARIQSRSKISPWHGRAVRGCRSTRWCAAAS